MVQIDPVAMPRALAAEPSQRRSRGAWGALLGLVALSLLGPRAAAAHPPDRPAAKAEPAAAATAGEGSQAAAGEAAARPPVKPWVQVHEPRLTGGKIPHVKEMLEKTGKAVARCVVEHGGLKGRRGRVELELLVRSRGRAEGVEVAAFKGIDSEASRCVQQAFKNKWLGVPSAEPVAVAVTLQLSAEPPAARGQDKSSAPDHAPAQRAHDPSSASGDTVPAHDKRPSHGQRPARGKRHRR
jgi:hypothetical protein